MINWEKSEIIKKFELIKKEHTETIKDYSYFINPLLNVIYPQFLRKEFNQKYFMLTLILLNYNIQGNFALRVSKSIYTL